MKLSIITINWNNAVGLQKTMESVMGQSCQDFEYLVIDGGSTDGGLEVIKKYDGAANLHWISEKDSGIYNAMNKGILMAKGDYLHFLNSGDCLMNPDVVKNMFAALEHKNYPDIMIGNLYKMHGSKAVQTWIPALKPTLLSFYSSSLNHPASYIKRSLFEKYDLYDEKLRIASDWKWFMQVVVFGNVDPVFVNVNVTLFDSGGISESNSNLLQKERSKTLKELIQPKILADYDRFADDIRMMQRIRRHKGAFKLVNIIERVLFKMEKRQFKRRGIK